MMVRHYHCHGCSLTLMLLLHTESALDESIPKNIGFVVPVDEPGIEAKRPCCVRQCCKQITES